MKEVATAKQQLDGANAASVVWGMLQLLNRKDVLNCEKGKSNREKIRVLYKTRMKARSRPNKSCSVHMSFSFHNVAISRIVMFSISRIIRLIFGSFRRHDLQFRMIMLQFVVSSC